MTASHESIQTVDNLLAYFRDELVEALDEVDVDASEETEAYLVHLLKGFTRLEPESADEVGFDKPAAFYLGEAMNLPGGRRVEAYRRLGDASLFNCGFFDAYLARGLVNASYYQGVGRLAYDKLSSLHATRQSASPFQPVFEELAAQFDAVVEALQWVGRSLQQSDDVPFGRTHTLESLGPGEARAEADESEEASSDDCQSLRGAGLIVDRDESEDEPSTSE